MARSRQVRRGILDVRRQIRRQGAGTTGRAESYHANRRQISRLGSGYQIRKAASVVLAEDEPDSDEFWNRRTIPLCLPPCFLPGTGRTPISEIEPLDIGH